MRFAKTSPVHGQQYRTPHDQRWTSGQLDPPIYPQWTCMSYRRAKEALIPGPTGSTAGHHGGPSAMAVTGLCTADSVLAVKPNLLQ